MNENYMGYSKAIRKELEDFEMNQLELKKRNPKKKGFKCLKKMKLTIASSIKKASK